MVVINCLTGGILLQTAFGRFNGKGSDEHLLLRSLQNTFQSGKTVLRDSFFASYFFVANIQAKRIDLLMEQHLAKKHSTDFQCGRKLGKHDQLIVINKPKIRSNWMSQAQYKAGPAPLTISQEILLLNVRFISQLSYLG